MADLGSILVTAAMITVGSGIGVLILIKGCSKIGRHLANCRETQTVAVVPESVDEVFEFARKPDYSGLRRSILKADDTGGLVR